MTKPNPIAPKTDTPARPRKQPSGSWGGEVYLVRDVEDYVSLVESTLAAERASRLQAERKAWNDAIDAASTACDGQAHLDDVSLTDEEEAWNRACNECGNAVDALSKPSVSPEF